MRLRLATSPWWVQGLVYGVFFGAFMSVFERFEVGRWAPALLGGFAGGAVFGIGMGLVMSRLNGRMLSGLEGLTATDRQLVVRASVRGPVPSESRLRDAARALAERRLTELRRQRRWTLPVFAAMTVLYLVLAVTGSPWWWLAVLAVAVVIATVVLVPARLERRLELLRTV